MIEKVLKLFLLIVLCFILPLYVLYGEDNIEKSGISSGDLMIVFEGALGFPGGKIFDIEEGLFSMEVAYENGEVKEAKPSHIVWNYGLTAEYLLSGRIGLQAGYHFRSVSQSMSVDTSGYETPDLGGTLLKFDNPIAGCIYHVYIDPMWSVYLSGRIGYALNGILSPMPAAYDYFGAPLDKYKLTGFNYGIGIGANFYYNYFVFGFSCMYTGYNFSSSEKIYDDLASDFSFSSFDLVFSIGVKVSLF